MSVINQMLRDLDARQASSQERAGLPPGLRTLPPSPRRGLPTWGLLAIGVIIGALVVGFYALWLAEPSAPPPATQPVPPAPAQVAAPVVAAVENAQPEMQQSSSSLQSATAITPPTAPASAPLPPIAPSLANDKNQPREKPKKETPPAASKPPAKADAVPSAAGADRAAQTLPDVAAAPSPHPAATGGNGQIDKKPKATETNELAESEYRKGLQAASQGDPATALSALRRALQIDPRHAQARQALLAVLAGLRQWEEVKRVAEQGLALDPVRTPWATLLARLRYEEGDVDGALKILENHAAHAARDADFHALFAYLLQKRQRPAEAAQHYRAALQLRPNEGRWWFGLGLVLEAAGHADEARASFAKAHETGNLPAEMSRSVEDRLRASSPSGSSVQ